MALLTKAPRGTQDILPKDSGKLQFVEGSLLDTAKRYGFQEIRTPVFEHTELFLRSVGETTDVVQKEMYTFQDKGNRSITLRPEGTAGAARAVLEHSLHNDALPVKVSYLTGCYRYEKPQAGRLREFHQFGIEIFGAEKPAADAEIICVANEALTHLGVKNLQLQLNSIGCPTCRAEYHKALRAFFEARQEDLCDTCKGRLERNPMRILDCKSPVCQEIAKDAPNMLDYLCDDCKEHFEGVKGFLDAAGLSYVINPRIVRGLDYYTRTVFEFVSQDIGSQGTVCGGGRYDGLMEELGGPHLPSLGFGMGIERLMLVLKNQGAELPDDPPCNVYIASMGDAAAKEAFRIAELLREEGFSAQCDLVGRSLKAQMKYADKIGAQHTMVLGDNELAAGKANLKDMATGEQVEVDLGEGLIDVIYRTQLEKELANISQAGGEADIASLLAGIQNREE